MQPHHPCRSGAWGHKALGGHELTQGHSSQPWMHGCAGKVLAQGPSDTLGEGSSHQALGS